MFRARAPTLLAKLSPEYLVKALKQRKTTSFFGVPDVQLSGLTTYLMDHCSPSHHVVAATSESAAAMAAGTHLGTGSVPCVYLPNTAIGGTVHSTLGLMHRDLSRIPCLMIVAWRGQPLTNDSAQHTPQGKLTEHCLTAMDVPYSILCESDDMEFYLDTILEKAYYHFNAEGAPYALLCESNTIEPYISKTQQDPSLFPTLSHSAAVEQILRQLDTNDTVVCSDEGLAREIHTFREGHDASGHSRDFFALGCPGLGSSVGVGVALAQESRQVICIDTDCSSIPQMSLFATVGAAAAHKTLATGHGPLRNWKHIVITSGVHSNSSVPTAGLDASLTAVAKACGYFLVREEPVLELGDLVAAVAELKKCDGPAFLEVLTSPSGATPTAFSISAPREAKTAFMDGFRAS